MNGSADDHAHMARAIRLANRGLYTADPNPRVGCVITQNGDVVGTGWHARAGEAHAEIRALEAAGSAARGATAYVTLEPCCHHGRTPPCTDALLAAGIVRVVIATSDPNPAVAGAGQRQLQDAGVEVTSGVLEDEARMLNDGFIQRMETGRPWVRAKIATSLDGRTALANGVSEWITGEAARNDVQRLRARSSAILTGIGTVAADDPLLNVRLDELGEVQQPVRVVLDSRLSMASTSKMLASGGAVRIFCTACEPDAVSRLETAGAIVEQLEPEQAGTAAGRVSLPDVMRRLGELEFNEILVEAGPVLNGALLDAGLIDELVVYMASHVLGADARGMFAIPELTDMSHRIRFELVELRRVGADCRLTFRPTDGTE
jgi:diaminohydroxyphosphoribosylaminopyrimidine deaminase/5-amino-6-(5-phosphoribosylamino)uracil reductase